MRKVDNDSPLRFVGWRDPIRSTNAELGVVAQPVAKARAEPAPEWQLPPIAETSGMAAFDCRFLPLAIEPWLRAPRPGPRNWHLRHSHFVNNCRVADVTGVAVAFGRSSADEVSKDC